MAFVLFFIRESQVFEMVPWPNIRRPVCVSAFATALSDYIVPSQQRWVYVLEEVLAKERKIGAQRPGRPQKS